MSRLTLSPSLWEDALTLPNYVAGMTQHQRGMIHRLSYVELRPEERAFFKKMDHVRYVLVMNEDWCGDGVLNLPIISKIVQAMPRAELKIVYRTGQDDLNAHYTARGVTHLPVVTFFDDDGAELATWEEHPAMGTTLFEEWKASQPEFLAIRYATDIDEETRSQKLKPFYRQLLQEMFTWYDGERNLQKATVDEIHELLAADSSGSLI